MFDTPLEYWFVPLLLISLGFMVISLVFFVRTNYLLKYPGPFQFFFVFFILYNVISWPFVLAGLSLHLGKLVDFDYITYLIFFFYLHLCLIAFPLGAIFANKVLVYSKEEIVRFYEKALERKRHYLIVVFVFFLFLPILIWYARQGFHYITYLFTLKYTMERGNIATEGSYWGYVMSKAIVPFAGVFAFGYGLLFIRSRAGKAFWGVIITSLSLLGSIATLQKSPLILFLLMVGLFVLLTRGKPARWKSYLTLATLALSLAIVVSWYSGGMGNLGMLRGLGITLLAYIDRISFEGNYLAYEAMRLAAQQTHLFLGGTSFPTLFHGTDLYNYLGERLWIVLFSNLYGAGVVGTANTCFITALYWDFGFFGGIFGSFIFGFFLQSVQAWLLRSPKTLFTMVTFVFLTASVLKFNYTHLGTAFLSEGFGLVLAFFAAYRLLDSIENRIKMNRVISCVES